jgi:transposase
MFDAVIAARTGRSAVEHIGIDVHKNESQICWLTEQGEILERRIATRRDRFAAELGQCPRARIVIEASTESEWVARCLEDLGHEVIVADPNYAPMYATRSRRVKTDRRDAQALMDACRLGAYRRAHRTSETQRRVRALLTARDNLVRTRIREIQVIRALLRREGIRVRSGQTSSFAERMAEQDLPEWLRTTVAPVVKVMDEVNEQLVAMDRELQRVVGDDPVVRRLCTAPGIGPVTAIAFVSTIDRVERFDRAHQVESYLGLVPREFSSGERQQRGSVTKAGNGRLRWLLVEAAWSILRSKRSSTEPLREWAERMATRRGRRIAVVALARRLAGILYAMWRDETDFGHRARRRSSVSKAVQMT